MNFKIKAYEPKRPFYVLIPAHNEGHWHFNKLLLNLHSQEECKKIIVVDDCSTDGTASLIERLKRTGYEKLDLVKNEKRLGKEGAIKKGLARLVNCEGFDPDSYIALMDGDGQHKIEDMLRMIYAAESTQADVVCGYRSFEDMPHDRKLANWWTATAFKLARFSLKDPLFGQKVIHASYAKRLAQDLQQHGGYRVELSLIDSLLEYGASFCQIPVKAEYSNCSKKSGMGLFKKSWIENAIYVFIVGARARGRAQKLYTS